MQAMYCLIEEIHVAVDGSQALEINARPLREGSLEIHIELAALAMALWHGQGLVDLIVLVARQFLDLKKRLNGAKYYLPGDNNVVYGEGSTINVYPQTAVLLAPDNVANRQLQTAFRAISADPRVDGVRVQEAETGESLVRVEREQFGAFRIPKGIGEEALRNEKVIRNAHLRIRSAAFDEKLCWRFVHEGRAFSAVLADDGFLKRVMSGEKFASGDTLVADLLVRQRWDPVVNGFVDEEYEIIGVTDHVARNDRRGQQRLFEEEG